MNIFDTMKAKVRTAFVHTINGKVVDWSDSDFSNAIKLTCPCGAKFSATMIGIASMGETNTKELINKFIESHKEHNMSE